MLVRDLMALLSREHPDSPITVEGLCPHGDYLVEADLCIEHDGGPEPDIDEVNITWSLAPEVEAAFKERLRDAPLAPVRRLP